MAEPTTNYEAGYPDFIDELLLVFEQSQANDRDKVLARFHNAQEKKIQALMEYLGVHPFQGWDPANPAAGPTTSQTINERIINIGGTGSCLEQGVICNYLGSNGIDPTGLVLTMVNDLPEFKNPGTGWIPTNPPNPYPSCPPFPEEPPYPTPTPTGFPTPPGYNPDTYPWPIPGFDPDTGFEYPMGPWMQFITWAVGSLFAAYQARNISNINFGPAGIPFSKLPQVWQKLLTLPKVFPNTTVNMPAGAGTPFNNPLTTDRASLLDSWDVTLSMLEKLRDAFGIEYTVIFGNGSDALTVQFDHRFNAGEFGADHSKVFTVISPDGDFEVKQVELSTVKQEGWANPGFYNVVFTTSVPFNARLVLVYQRVQQIATLGSPTSWREEIISGGPTFVTTDIPADGKAARPVLTVWARTAPGVAWVPLEYNGGTTATNANDFGLSVGAFTATIDTSPAAGYTQVRVLYQCQIK